MSREKMRELVEGLREDHECGDFGRALETRLALAQSILDNWQEPGLPWVSVEDRPPEASDADDERMVLGAPCAGGDFAETVFYKDITPSLWSHWLPLSALPLPGDEVKPAQEPEGLRAEVERMASELSRTRRMGPLPKAASLHVWETRLRNALARPAAAEGVELIDCGVADLQSCDRCSDHPMFHVRTEGLETLVEREMADGPYRIYARALAPDDGEQADG